MKIKYEGATMKIYQGRKNEWKNSEVGSDKESPVHISAGNVARHVCCPTFPTKHNARTTISRVYWKYSGSWKVKYHARFAFLDIACYMNSWCWVNFSSPLEMVTWGENNWPYSDLQLQFSLLLGMGRTSIISEYCVYFF